MQLTMNKISGIIITVAIAALLITFLNSFVKKKIVRDSRFDSKNNTKDPIPFILIQMADILILLLTLIVILDLLGFNVSKILAGLGIASAIVGLALQDTIKDILMGAHLYRDKYFTTGDYIEYEGNIVKVETFSLRTTKLRRADGSIVSVSNRNLETVAKAGEYRYFEIPVKYTENPAQVRKVMEEITEEFRKMPSVREASFSGIKKFGEFSVIYAISVHIDLADYFGILYRGNALIQEKLAEEGIEIAHNTLDVHS